MPELIGGRRAWLMAHPIAADALWSACLMAVFLSSAFVQGWSGAVGGRPGLVALLPGGLAVLSLTLRRSLPVMVLAFVAVMCLTSAAAGREVPAVVPALTFLVATYTVAAHRGLGQSLPAGAAALAVFLGLLFAADTEFWPVATNTSLFVGVWWLGRSVRLRRAYLDELESRARRLERAREADARAARTEERSRIARELHDVVAHHVSVMTVQAGAARRVLHRDPQAVQDALTTIEQMGRTALGEMRRVVGVLRTEAEPARSELSPQPGVHDVSALLDHLRETGLKVQLWVEGESRPLTPGVDLAAFRLIQEALTNTLKHAGPQARAWVRIHYTDRRLTVEVEDDGRGPAAGLGQADGPRGHGLVGMRERVALYGGDLRIGPRLGGGFEVRACFPLEVR